MSVCVCAWIISYFNQSIINNNNNNHDSDSSSSSSKKYQTRIKATNSPLTYTAALPLYTLFHLSVCVFVPLPSYSLYSDVVSYSIVFFRFHTQSIQLFKIQSFVRNAKKRESKSSIWIAKKDTQIEILWVSNWFRC